MAAMLKYVLLFSVCFFSFVSLKAERGVSAGKVLILAGAKSHPAGYHEYIKSARLIKAMLDKNGPSKLSVEK